MFVTNDLDHAMLGLFATRIGTTTSSRLAAIVLAAIVLAVLIVLAARSSSPRSSSPRSPSPRASSPRSSSLRSSSPRSPRRDRHRRIVFLPYGVAAIAFAAIAFAAIAFAAIFFAARIVHLCRCRCVALGVACRYAMCAGTVRGRSVEAVLVLCLHRVASCPPSVSADHRAFTRISCSLVSDLRLIRT